MQNDKLQKENKVNSEVKNKNGPSILVDSRIEGPFFILYVYQISKIIIIN